MLTVRFCVAKCRLHTVWSKVSPNTGMQKAKARHMQTCLRLPTAHTAASRKVDELTMLIVVLLKQVVDYKLCHGG